MKLDFRAELTTGQKRTITLLNNAMVALLQKRDLAEITVRELCEVSMIPHSTFYYYYEDKYDALLWMLCRIFFEQYPEMDRKMNHYDNVSILANRVYDFIEENRSSIFAIVKHNPQNGLFHQTVRKSVVAGFGVLVSNCTSGKEYAYPYEVVFNTYVNGFLEIFNQIFYENQNYTREQILNYMNGLYVN